MKRSKMGMLILVSILMLSLRLYAQMYLPYAKLIDAAEESYEKKQYSEAAHLYAKAFRLDVKISRPDDLYNAACCWALVNEKDTAFSLLLAVASGGGYSDLDHLVKDEDLRMLHDDTRWADLCNTVRQNKKKIEAKINKPIQLMLDTIFTEDQQYRVKLNHFPFT
ncbi:hypothetical protein [uncultured Chitinophaga sp.]|jgi:hypothetical protein|uniref:hypothetical protein n=1 Tax=uncultured Chitinophaga sp. TaxID=339340 RepID=UPI002630D795|nr:hypothetical protein [uncultured Chitinophaga sp.]